MAKSRIYKPTAEAISMASDILKKGEVVSFPTETVYGLGADATNSDAVAKIFSAKNRPSFNPLIIHLPNTQMVEKYVELSQLTKDLSNIFWPGPFTMVLPLKKNSGISTLITAGLETVAIRVPSHPVAHTLLNEFNGPIAAPSANKSGQISPTTAQHVDQEFGDELELIIDGGPCDNGLESTIVKVVYDQLTILRPGNVTVEEIQEKIEVKIVTDTQPTDNPIAPGQLKSHYAPNANVRLNVINPEMNEAYLAFGDTNQVENMLNLSPSGDLEEAASNLFSMMRSLDQLNLKTISVAPIPKSGVGVAINDRLERAAAPKDLLKD
ncbi:L-threonylcarbamoyladenylate synthase [Pseudemcibacter sp.]|uniref:L-threonylcarbamoyladenylate synthase n=1 Tax=Pseudemcibacter sp. TaxID=2943293 RepID=UPI003F69601A